MKSIRGAIAVVDNNELSIISSAKSLILSVMKENNITEEDVVFALFTVTQDLDQAFPAKAFRELGMNSIAAIDTVAPNIKDDLAGCIRILLTINNSTNDIKHIYLNDAKSLRPDR